MSEKIEHDPSFLNADEDGAGCSALDTVKDVYAVSNEEEFEVEEGDSIVSLERGEAEWMVCKATCIPSGAGHVKTFANLAALVEYDYVEYSDGGGFCDQCNGPLGELGTSIVHCEECGTDFCSKCITKDERASSIGIFKVTAEFPASSDRIASRLEAIGYKMADILTMCLGRTNSSTIRTSEKFIEKLSDDFEGIIAEEDKASEREHFEKINMKDEDFRGADQSESDFEMRGVKLKLLRKIAELAMRIGGEWTVGRISNVLVGAHEILKKGHRWGEDVVKADALTFADQMSLIDVLKTHHKDASNLHPTLGVCYDEVVGKQATKFCSFAYNGDFFELVSSLEALVSANPEYADEYFWFDMLVNNQWVALEHDFDWWASTFKTAVKKIGHLVLICSPWSDPEPLKRAWCLWEIYCALESGGKFDVALGADQHNKFIDAIIADPDEYYNMLGNIDVQKSNCWLPADKKNIFKAVKRSIGFAKLNTMIIDKMREWIMLAIANSINTSSLETPREQLCGKLLAKGGLLVNIGDYTAAMAIFQQCLIDLADIENGMKGKIFYFIGYVYRLQGDYPKAMESYEISLPIQLLNLGEFHKDVARTYNAIGLVYWKLGNYTMAVQYHNKALAIRLQTLGPVHPHVAMSYNNIALVYNKQNNYTMAIQFHKKSLYIKLLKLGASHPDVAASYNNIAVVYNRQEKYSTAMYWYQKSLDICLQTLGEDHPDSINTIKNMDLTRSKM